MDFGKHEIFLFFSDKFKDSALWNGRQEFFSFLHNVPYASLKIIKRQHYINDLK